MQDAVVLANYLYEMKGLAFSDISATLDQFKDERYSKVKVQYEASKSTARLVYGQSYFDRFMRMIVFNWLPESVMMKGGFKGVEFRPQASFIPQIPIRGSGPVLPQRPSQRYLDEQAKLDGVEHAPVVV
ncbi:hypothetical protein EC957_009602 [Mortierella hygrophila]|uniref:Uncharacterized protein n=1 Tax=Mortierella hygrophila TaxID=979708 RepID=A0A9P6EVE0_9FUNG|nr:hypothetical protein EC957_009602 [Mortierella hygrophila]